MQHNVAFIDGNILWIYSKPFCWNVAKEGT